MTGFIPTILKYTFSALFALASVPATGKKRFALQALLELSVIFAVTDLALIRFTLPVWIVNALVIFLFNAQALVLCFGGSYTTLVMLTNLDSWQDLLGKMGQYIAAILAVLVFTALPVRKTPLPLTGDLILLCAVLFFQILALMACGPEGSPFFGLMEMIRTFLVNRKWTSAAEKTAKDRRGEFFKDSLPGFRDRPESLPESPNIVLIFTEGLSSHMIRDKRKIMPNAARFLRSSIRFRNYYNHTYATYCALIGQLYSGYQLNNYDASTLVSLQSILKGRGYDTVMINTEPKNRLFTDYLGRLGFDRVVTGFEDDLRGEARSLSDRQAYELLWETLQDQAKKDVPFLTAIYTFGSHISFDSPKGEARFEDGKDTTLNKMRNVDVQFGAFMEKLKNSPLGDNTLVVFTGDHCAYGDLFYRRAFPAYERVNTDVDEMPLAIWHRDVVPETIDAKGRNTLDMVPTLLDYLDISVPNYFLGTSLFGPGEEDGPRFDTLFYDATYTLSTEGGSIRPLTERERKRFEKALVRYFTAKTQKAGREK
jgi:hypothetical protein